MNECFVGPMVEFHESTTNEHSQKEKCQYINKIPHCIEDEGLWDKIRVRSGNRYRENNFSDVERFDNRRQQETYFEIEKDFIIIYTTHFTNYICSLCDYLYCSDLAQVFLFGSLTPARQLTLVEVKPFLCSRLYVIKDFKAVSISQNKILLVHMCVSLCPNLSMMGCMEIVSCNITVHIWRYHLIFQSAIYYQVITG